MWRLVPELTDPATVPEFWTCDMNSDSRAQMCGVGGERIIDEDMVEVQFTCGSMVWAKLKGYPWWPAMVGH